MLRNLAKRFRGPGGCFLAFGFWSCLTWGCNDSSNFCKVDTDCPDLLFCEEGECITHSCPTAPCPEGKLCDDGRCIPSLCAGMECQENWHCEDGGCVADLCGDIRCDPGEECLDEHCRCGGADRDCPPESACCGTECVDPASDPRHCGSCGHACPDAEGQKAWCRNSRCGHSCAGPWADCDGDQASACETALGTTTDCLSCGDRCDDANPCTDDACDPQNGCQHGNNTASCSDGNDCTVNDRCTLGACQGIQAPERNDCGARRCAGLKWIQPTCSSGFCSGTFLLEDCDDGNPCSDDNCDVQNGCTHALNSNACDDGNPCTDFDQCADGICGGVSLPNGAECGQRFCLGNAWIMHTCESGSCLRATFIRNCGDGNLCTDDLCNPDLGCVYGNNREWCDDQNPCTRNDRCANGTCVGEALDDHTLCGEHWCIGLWWMSKSCRWGSCNWDVIDRDCDDDNPCSSDACDDTTGCRYQNREGACDDGNSCTSDERCTNGACIGTTKGDGSSCGAKYCDGPGWFQHHCVGGWCSGSTLVADCDDGLVCTEDLCDPLSGCTNPSVPNGTPCGPSMSCFVGDCVECSKRFCLSDLGCAGCEPINVCNPIFFCCTTAIGDPCQ